MDMASHWLGWSVPNNIVCKEVENRAEVHCGIKPFPSMTPLQTRETLPLHEEDMDYAFSFLGSEARVECLIHTWSRKPDLHTDMSLRALGLRVMSAHVVLKSPVLQSCPPKQTYSKQFAM